MKHTQKQKEREVVKTLLKKNELEDLFHQIARFLTKLQ